MSPRATERIIAAAAAEQRPPHEIADRMAQSIIDNRRAKAMQGTS
jgi:hypothetical protein